MRLIDADALIRRFHDSPTFEMSEFLRTLAIGFAKEAPTIDAVEVVRCSECRYGTVSTTTPMAICNHPNGLVAPRWGSWCSYGKWKEDNHE